MAPTKYLSVTLLSVALVTALCGCQSLQSMIGSEQSATSATDPATAAGLFPENASLSALVDYAEWLNQQSLQVLRPIYRQAQAKSASASLSDQVNMALLLSVPGTPFQDDNKAQALLTTALEALPDQHRWRDFIRLQLLGLRSRQQLTLAWRQQINLEKKRADLLQQQLDELKSIEKGLIQRQEEFE